MIKYLIALLLISASVSRLIRPDEIAELELKQSRLLNPHLKTQDSPNDNSSYAKPVQGIANATSGYLSVNDPNSNSKLFFIFYQSRGLTAQQQAKDVPTIIWLQGGPGGSSQAGNFLEMGPYGLTLDKSTGKWKETAKGQSWNDYYNMLFIDNPRGTGYSIADKESYVTTEDEVANDFLQALLNFYALDTFSSFTKTPLYIFGESYAGHYIPAISKRIIESNKDGKVLQIPLKGIGIGNGFVDPVHQLAENALFAYALGLTDDVQRAKIEYYQLEGVANIQRGAWLAAQQDFDKVMDNIVTFGGDLNVYNFRNFGEYDFSSIVKFFNDADTVKRYNVDPSVAGHFKDINIDVYNALSTDFMQSVADRVAYVAASGLPIMFYNGQDDIICNTPAVQNWITNLAWSGQTGFYNANFNVWNYKNGTVAGLQKIYQNFSFVIVNKAGHLSPMDQIETTTEMVRRFVAGQTNWTKPLTNAQANFETIQI
jgi:vitellogenic carboxypeptidase-like protein